MLHEPHTSVSRPAFLVIISDNVFVVRVRMLGQIALYELFGLVGREAEQDVNAVDVSHVESNRMRALDLDVLIGEEVVGQLWRSGHLACAPQAEHEQVEHETVVLHDERGELQAAYDAVRVRVVHVFVVDHDVVLRCHVVGDVVVYDETQQAVEECQVDLLVHLFEFRFEHYVAFAFCCVPDVVQVVNSFNFVLIVLIILIHFYTV
jgi:hypothetical protein